MSEFFLCEIEKLKKQGVEVIKIEKEYRENGKDHTTIEVIRELDFSEHDKVFEDKIYELKKELSKMKQSQDNYFKLLDKYREQNEELTIENQELKKRIDELEQSRSEWIDKAVEWQQKCKKLESKETEICEKEPNTSDSAPSIEWYDNRHQSDCIEINRLNTTIDVLIHKAEYLRQFAGLE